MKGILFSIDAIMAIGIITLLFGAVTLINNSEPAIGTKQALLSSQATDEAYQAYLSGETDLEVVNEDTTMATCHEIFEYQTNGTITPRVKKCVELE